MHVEINVQFEFSVDSDKTIPRAEQVIEGFKVPWTSNPVDRLVGEVSERCKN